MKHEKKITKIKNVTAIRCGIEEILTLLTDIMHLNYVGGIYAHIQAGKKSLIILLYMAISSTLTRNRKLLGFRHMK